MKISIIIPTKNEERNIGNCLDSLARQSFKDFEVLVCDGGSTDKTKEIVETFGIEFLSLKPDLGYQRRFGAEKAKGEYLCFIDADMVLDPKVFQSCIEAFSNEPLAISHKPGAIIIPEVSFGIGFWAKVRDFEKRLYIGDDRVEAARFFTREAYNASGGWQEGMASGEDWDLTRRVREKGFAVARVNELIRNNEWHYSPWKAIKKKFYYSQKAKPFVAQNVKGFKDYFFFVFRPAFFHKWRAFLKHPVLGIAFKILWLLELTAGFLGLASKRFLKLSYEKTK